MEKNIDGKMKSVASIPANYVSILQLQERWLKEKEKEKELAERGVKQQQVEDDGQRKRKQGNRMKAMEPRVKKLEEKGLGMHCRANRWKKEANCVEGEKLEVSAIASKVGDSREKKNKGGSVEEVVNCESKVPRENNPVRVCRSKGENAARDSIAVETQFQHLCLKKRVEEQGREVKGPARLKNGQDYYRNQRHDDWTSTRVIRATGNMMWVKKGKNDGAGGEIGV